MHFMYLKHWTLDSGNKRTTKINLIYLFVIKFLFRSFLFVSFILEITTKKKKLRGRC